MADINVKEFNLQNELAVIMKQEDPKVLLDMVKRAVNMAVSPVVALTIQADTRSGQITFRYIGPDEADVDLLLEMLENTRRELMKAERQSRQPQEPAKV